MKMTWDKEDWNTAGTCRQSLYNDIATLHHCGMPSTVLKSALCSALEACWVHSLVSAQDDSESLG